ncbi:MAG: hypothetical protein KAS32_05595 [Candidatus Peribacteraceae bacterium]|nr:hypothetical protein [Candidatus Peribacteraceae bacterium]
MVATQKAVRKKAVPKKAVLKKVAPEQEQKKQPNTINLKLPMVAVGQVAFILNISKRRVAQLVVEGVITKEARGKYELQTVIREYIAYLQTRQYGSTVLPVDLHQEKIRLTTAQADEKELAVSQIRGELIPTPLVLETWQMLRGNTRAKFLSFPHKVAGEVATLTSVPEIEQLVRDMVYEALEELSQDGLPESVRKSLEQYHEGLAATAQHDSEPVGRPVPQTE